MGAFAEQPYFVRPHYVFNSGIGWSLPHWGAGNVYHEDDHGTPFYDFSTVDQTYDAIVGAGPEAARELAFTPRALVPDDAEAGFAFHPQPHAVEHLRGRALVIPAEGLPGSGAAWCVRWWSTASQRYGADHVRTWFWELWNEPDIDLLARHRRAVLRPLRRHGGSRQSRPPGCPWLAARPPPAISGRAGGAPAFLRAFLEHCARAGTPLDFVSFHTKGGRFSPWRVYGPIGGPPPEEAEPLRCVKMLREVRAFAQT